jgi:imidazoleglycerol-phosphate dehydratase
MKKIGRDGPRAVAPAGRGAPATRTGTSARRAAGRGRTATVTRRTKETSVAVTLGVDGTGKYDVQTGVPFLNHMLELFTRHGFFDLTVRATGDVEVDDHHTVEDVGLTLGQAFRDALGDKEGIRRFGEATVPLDEALASVVVDLSGRPFLAYDLKTRQTRIGSFDVELIHDFLLALVNQLGINLHVRMLAGRNPHHIIEAAFKAFARAMDLATQRDPRVVGVLSTKGTL